jgi:hypothetical protein
VLIQNAATFDVAFTDLAVKRYCTDPWVFFSRPKDRETVSSPVRVGVWAQNIIIEPAGQVRSGHGHLHVIVNNGCMLEEGTHQDYDQGEFQRFELALAPGTHHLCLQAANGAHEALDVTQEVNISVK